MWYRMGNSKNEKDEVQSVVSHCIAVLDYSCVYITFKSRNIMDSYAIFKYNTDRGIGMVNAMSAGSLG